MRRGARRVRRMSPSVRRWSVFASRAKLIASNVGLIGFTSRPNLRRHTLPASVRAGGFFVFTRGARWPWGAGDAGRVRSGSESGARRSRSLLGCPHTRRAARPKVAPRAPCGWIYGCRVLMMPRRRLRLGYPARAPSMWQAWVKSARPMVETPETDFDRNIFTLRIGAAKAQSKFGVSAYFVRLPPTLKRVPPQSTSASVKRCAPLCGGASCTSPSRQHHPPACGRKNVCTPKGAVR